MSESEGFELWTCGRWNQEPVPGRYCPRLGFAWSGTESLQHSVLQSLYGRAARLPREHRRFAAQRGIVSSPFWRLLLLLEPAVAEALV